MLKPKDVTGEADRRNAAYADGGSEVAFNGAVRLDLFKELLLRIRDEWGNSTVIITENDAGFPGDDDLKDGQVNDEKRSRCMTVHIAAGR